MRADSWLSGIRRIRDVHSVNGRRCRRRGHFRQRRLGRSGALCAADNGGLEEIVVTAQRRVESAQNVGIAMSVLVGAKLGGQVHQLYQ